MRILVDGGCWANGRGYGRFTREILTALARAPRHEYVVLLEKNVDGFRLPFETVRVDLSQSIADAASSGGRRSLRDLLAFSVAAAKQRADAIFFPSVYSYFPILRPMRGLVGIHDTMADRFPQFAFDSPRQQRFWKWKMRVALAQCREVLTVSEYSKESIASHWKLPRQRIHVVCEGPAPVFGPQDIPKRDIVLYVGGVSPNKNLATLIRAFSKVQRGFELVIAGDYQGDGFKTC